MRRHYEEEKKTSVEMNEYRRFYKGDNAGRVRYFWGRKPVEKVDPNSQQYYRCFTKDGGRYIKRFRPCDVNSVMKTHGYFKMELIQ